jgi:hypothetical protein
MHGEKMTTVSFLLNKRDHKALKDAAKKHGVTQSGLLRIWIQREGVKK